MTRISPLVLKLGIAIVSLASAISVYLFLRLDPPLLLEPFEVSEKLFPHQAHWFGSAPSFFYTLAVGLLLGSFSSSPRSGQAHCLVWTGLALLLELTQHPDIAGSFAGLVTRSLPASVTEIILPYWSRGSFDSLDLAATAAGGLLALVIIRRFINDNEAGYG